MTSGVVTEVRARHEGANFGSDVFLIADSVLGIILIGAQQTASEVERRIVANSSIKVVGRLDPAEAGRPEYGFVLPSQRARATLAKPGTMFVSQPEIPCRSRSSSRFRRGRLGCRSAGPPPASSNGSARRDPFRRPRSYAS